MVFISRYFIDTGFIWCTPFVWRKLGPILCSREAMKYHGSLLFQVSPARPYF
ncbi:hypothetical protein BC939DRAFT_465313 [Gamsiella multidivaricata]|uniref:uncharacterized protein n=1 Tax=Gamsiella multidivaricata TaxID=101098 RepID=UPI00221FB0A4|nr:uncharacterized protein BC939DRAFT_465313 [Gamsiella multidivaricata]KAI7817607.1 hypothetical protein BC939DRAFT_465313 [Gamsiella multidivaricata]